MINFTYLYTVYKCKTPLNKVISLQDKHNYNCQIDFLQNRGWNYLVWGVIAGSTWGSRKYRFLASMHPLLDPRTLHGLCGVHCHFCTVSSGRRFGNSGGFVRDGVLSRSNSFYISCGMVHVSDGCWHVSYGDVNGSGGSWHGSCCSVWLCSGSVLGGGCVVFGGFCWLSCGSHRIYFVRNCEGTVIINELLQFEVWTYAFLMYIECQLTV